MRKQFLSILYEFFLNQFCLTITLEVIKNMAKSKIVYSDIKWDKIDYTVVSKVTDVCKAIKEYYWNNADIFVLPTCFECFPLVVIEAMQHKLPIVSTDEGGIVDIVDNWNEEKLCGTGFLVHSQVLRENCCNESLGELTSEKEFEKTCAFNEIRGKETAEALSRLVKDEQLRKKMGQAGYQKYLEQLTLDKFEYNMLCCLKSALDD